MMEDAMTKRNAVNPISQAAADFEREMTSSERHWQYRNPNYRNPRDDAWHCCHCGAPMPAKCRDCAA
jgi:hypothetical protein